MSDIPLVERNSDDVFARLGEQTIGVGQFCADITAVAERLPNSRYIVNLCQDRYRFTVCFFASLARKTTNLLPSRREPQSVQELLSDYSDCVVVADQAGEGVDHQIHLDPGSNGSTNSPTCPGDHTGAVAFTSGSTGQPQAHAKTWQLLNTWRHVHWRYLPGDQQQPRGLVATVPSWHMYGLEWALLLPTVAPLTLHCGADFYPQDVGAALASFQEPSILISTPMHLRALRHLTAAPDNVSAVLSATSPLDDTLTRQIERSLGTQLFEIYGCSEVGSLASRYPSKDKAWQFFDCFDISYNAGAITVRHNDLPEAVTLADHFKQLDSARYALEGRNSDIVKVGGKRESLAHLNTILLNVNGVQDGVIYDPTAYGLPDNGRLAALAQAPGLTANNVRAGLAREMDSVFLPRPIRMVAQLPRDSTSKLKQADLAQLIVSLTDAHD